MSSNISTPHPSPFTISVKPSKEPLRYGEMCATWHGVDEGTLRVRVPSHVSNTTTSFSEPPPMDEVMSSSQSEHRDDGPSVSQVMRAAFPSLSPISAPDPVILARDSQSQDSHGGSGGDDSNIGNNHNSGSAISSISHASRSQSPHFFPRASSSSSISYVLPRDDVPDPTQPNTQSTQPSTQPIHPDPQHIMTSPSMSTYPNGPSLLPVPPHRRREVVSLQAARHWAKAEVIPEAPASTAVPSVQASVAAPSLSTPAAVDIPQIAAASSISRCSVQPRSRSEPLYNPSQA
jgi:hypothetical protein